MKKYIIYYLILAPVIDYSYGMKYLYGADIVLYPNRIYKFIPIIIFLILLFKEPDKLLLWKYPFLVLVAALISFLVGLYYYPFEAFDTYVRLFSSLVFLFLAGKYITDEDIHKLINFMIIITIIPITISYLQFFAYVPYTDYDYIGGISLGRVSGGYEKQVSMLAYLIYTFPFAIYSFVQESKVIRKVGYSIYIILCFGVVLLSTHRVSIFVFTGIVLYMLYRYSRILFASILSLIAAIIIIFRDFLTDVFVISSGIQNFGSDIGRGRIGMWSDYIHHFFQSGWPTLLIGKGTPVLDISKGEFLPYLWDEPHSDIVRILYEYGFIGMVLFFMMLAVAIRRSVLYRRLRNSYKEKIIGDIGIIAGFSLMCYSISIEPSRYPSFWWYYSVVISYILVQTYNQQRELVT